MRKFQFEASEKQAKYYNATRREVKFNVGDLIWMNCKNAGSTVPLDNGMAEGQFRTNITTDSIQHQSGPNTRAREQQRRKDGGGGDNVG